MKASVLWVAVTLLLGGAPAAVAADLAAFAGEVGLREVGGFIVAVKSVRDTSRLPPRYVTKEEARAHGWVGGGLCEAWPGHAIGGDLFRNFAGALPEAERRVYREADLDESCRSRGPKRLIYSNDGFLYVTVNHYRSFVAVP